MFTDCSLSSVCPHALSIENLAARRAQAGGSVSRNSLIEDQAHD